MSHIVFIQTEIKVILRILEQLDLNKNYAEFKNLFNDTKYE